LERKDFFEGNAGLSWLYMPKRNELEMFGLVTQLLGAEQLKVFCEDGIERTVRIPGRMKKKIWIRQNDVIVVKLWEIEKTKGDAVWRYMPMQVEQLRRKHLLDKLPF